MISIILYGRNDNHGYNLHRRVALSLNCIAEVLTDHDDEIVFVDWNSPGRLPTLIEDVSDTLTKKCKRLLKTIKVNESIHSRIAPTDLKRPTIEPHARNVALRATNPNNKWVLSTNSDMIFAVPQNDLTGLVAGLTPGYYMAFRYEIPEFLWGSEPRNKPAEFISKFNEWTEQSTLMRQILLERDDHALPDAPGDFQLAPRETWFKIHGFPENMLYGWHVDSAVSKLLVSELGVPQILNDSQIKTAHCNHLRNLTHFHEPSSKQNNFNAKYDVIKSGENWGLFDEVLEVISLAKSKNAIDNWMQEKAVHRLLGQVALSNLTQNFEYPIDLSELFLLDVLVALTPGTQVRYFGVNEDYVAKLKSSCSHFGLNFDAHLLSNDSTQFTWGESFNSNTSLMILDFGLSDHRSELKQDVSRKIAIGRMVESISELAEKLRLQNKSCLVAAIGPLVWSCRTLFTSEFATPLANNYGLVIAGPVRPKSLLKENSSVSVLMLKSAVIGEYGVPARATKNFLGMIARKVPKPIKRILRPVVHWLLRSSGTLR